MKIIVILNHHLIRLKMKLIKTNKKGEAAEKSQRELTGLILSLLIVVVVVAMIFKLIALFSPKEDAFAKALFLRIVDDIKYIEPNSSMIEFLDGKTKNTFKDEKGSWGIVVFPKDYVSNKALSCKSKSSRQNFDGFEYNTLTRNENVAINCEKGKVCTCLFFATKEAKEIIFVKCNSIPKKLDLDKESCFLLKDLESDSYARIFYLNSDEDTFKIDMLKRAKIPSRSEKDALSIFEDIANRFGEEFKKLESEGKTNVLDKKFFNLSQLKDLGGYGIAIYSVPYIYDPESSFGAYMYDPDPKIYLSLVKKPDNLEECFSSNAAFLDESNENILLISSQFEDAPFIYIKDDENCRMSISKIRLFKDKKFVVFAEEYNPLNCTSEHGFLKDERVTPNSGYAGFQKSFELILLFEDTFNECSGFILTNEKNLGNLVIAR